VRAAFATVVVAAILAAPAGAAPAGKIVVCHGTASTTNPYVVITVSENATAGHKEGEAGHGKNNSPDSYGTEECGGETGGGYGEE
jgi:ABC-type sugar transport system substrate-binding protein